MSLLSLWFHPTIPKIETSGIGTFVLILFTLFLSDLLFYWYHRFLHKVSWAWPIHELHHADTELNATSSLRSYWFELPVQAVFIALPTRLLLGSDPYTQLHRVHHSIKQEHQDQNFAQFFPVIDIIFGTYHHPKRNEFPETGTHSLPVDEPVFSVLIRPLKLWLKR